MLRYRGKITPIKYMSLQSYLDKINSHTWENKLLKSSLILATYVNYALIEYGENVGISIDINLESIINSVVESDRLKF
jgi:hypothetical protein